MDTFTHMRDQRCTPPCHESVVHKLCCLRGHIQGHPDTHVETYGYGTSVGIINQADQEYIGHLTAEIPEGKGILPGYGSESGHRNPLPQQLHWWPGHKEGSDNVEIQGVELLSGGGGKGVATTPAESLFWSTKFTPTEVGFCIESHPRYEGGFFSIWGSSSALLPCGPVSWGYKQGSRFVSHQPASQEGGAFTPKTHSLHLR